ncbi:hypothetical protein KQI65_07995 [bacterium]|nr:hypothetical protein [bacterium]
MSKFETSLSDNSGCHITLFHDPEDPLSWVIRKWKKSFFGKKVELSRWFNSREQAEAFAESLLEEHRRAGRTN